MKTEKIKKGCGITLIILIIIIIGFFWMVKTAFGPSFKTINVDHSIGKLICEEEYNADMAAVFYDVEFKLESKDKQLINLGKLYFQREDWQTEFELKENENWYYLSSNHSNIYDLILTNKSSKENLSFNVKESKPKIKKNWKLGNKFSVKFRIDSIKQDFIYLTYKYQNTEFTSSAKSQFVEFKIDRPNNKLNIMKCTKIE